MVILITTVVMVRLITYANPSKINIRIHVNLVGRCGSPSKIVKTRPREKSVRKKNCMRNFCQTVVLP